jgi:hypothetical protein
MRPPFWVLPEIVLSPFMDASDSSTPARSVYVQVETEYGETEPFFPRSFFFFFYKLPNLAGMPGDPEDPSSCHREKPRKSGAHRADQQAQALSGQVGLAVARLAVQYRSSIRAFAKTILTRRESIAGLHGRSPFLRDLPSQQPRSQRRGPFPINDGDLRRPEYT